MSRQFWSEAVAWATVDGTAVANSTTEAIIFPNITVAGGYMADGRLLRSTLMGRWSNVVTAVPTLTFRNRWGGVAGTVLSASPAIVTPATATTNAIWEMQSLLQTRANGATGSIFCMGKASMFEDAAATFGTVGNYGVVQPMGSAGAATPAAVTVDLSVDQALSDTAQWSAASASNTMTGHIKVLESMN
jgi:hypothetical protein